MSNPTPSQLSIPSSSRSPVSSRSPAAAAASPNSKFSMHRSQKSLFLPPTALTARFSVAVDNSSNSADSTPATFDAVDFSFSAVRTRPRSQALAKSSEPEKRVRSQSSAIKISSPPRPANGPLSPSAVALELSKGSLSILQSAEADALEILHSKLSAISSESEPAASSSSSDAANPLIRLSLHQRSVSHSTIQLLPPNPIFTSGLELQWQLIAASAISFETLRASSAVLRLLQFGIPASVRPLVWMKLSGATEEKSKSPVDYYSRLCSIYNSHGSSFDEEIEKDVRRTLPSIQIFKTGDSEPSKMLTRILGCYSLRNNITGYCQGMNTLAGYLLTILDEESSFWVLTRLVEDRAGYYTRSMCGLEVDLRVLSSLLHYSLPQVAAQFQRFEVGVESFAVSWLVCLMCEAPIPLNECATFWDYLFIWGDELLFQLPIQMLKRHQKEILKLNEAVELLEFLLHSGIRNGISFMDLMKFELKQGKFTKEVEQLREFHKGEVVKMARQLNPNTARRLAAQHKFPDASHVQSLWEGFLEPAPWTVLLHSALQSPLKFSQALFGRVFTDQQKSKWREPGILSGVTERLFQTVDVTQSGFVTFEQFLMLSRIIMCGSTDERMKLAFQYFDENRDQRISQSELSRSFEKLHLLYNGMGEKIDDEKDVSKLFAQMIFDRCIHSNEFIGDYDSSDSHSNHHYYSSSSSTMSDSAEILHSPIDSRGLTFAHFSYLITLHPFSQSFFQLPEHSGGAI